MAESNNKFRLSKLLTDGGTFFAKELLKLEFSNAGFADINAFLNDAAVKRTLHRLHTQPRKVLHQSQMDLLYPASGTADIDDLDITLLTCILTNCFKLSASKQTTIAELRTIRNEFLGHTASYQLDNNSFKQQWQKVASFLESESNAYLSADCVKTITDMRKTIEGEILTHDLADKLFREMGMRHENQFHQITAEISTMNTTLNAMREDLKHMEKSDRKLKNEVRSYRYQTLPQKCISSKHKNEENVIPEEEICDPRLLYKDFDQQFIEAKIVEATAEIEVVKRYEKQALDIGELMYKIKKDEFVHTLKRNRILVLVGLPGSGKTFSALSIMSTLCEETVKPVVVGNLDYFRKVLDPSQKLVILVDDVLGRYVIDHAVVNKWNDIADLLLEHISSSNSYFIFTIYQSAKSIYMCESIFKNPVVIDDKTFMKENLLIFYARAKRIMLSENQRSDILATQQFAIGFPVLCSHMEGAFETIMAMFKSPYPHIEREIRALHDNSDPQYVVLLLCLLQGNNTETIDTELFDAIKSSHSFVNEGDTIKDIVDTLIGTFLKRDGVYISFLHDCILESTLKVGIQASRDVLLSHLPFEYIKYLFSILKTEIGQPYKDIYKKIFPSLIKKRGHELMKNEDSTTFLISELAEYQSDTEVLEHIVKPICDVEKLYSNDKKLLHIAAATGKVEAIQCLLKFKPEHMQSSDERGWNALHYAAASGSVAAVDFLIKPNLSRMDDQEERGSLINCISPETKTSCGSNILHIAADTGKIELMKYIISEYKNLVFMTNEKGWNALHKASQKQSITVVKMLIEAGLKPETRTTGGRNILHIAASNGNMEVVRYVTEDYKDLLHSVDNNGWNALHYASEKQTKQMIKVLIEAGLKPKTKKTDGSNILHIAADNGIMEVVRYITENYKDLIHTVDNNGWNALHIASQKQSLPMIELLIEAGLRPKTRTTDGLNILHIAAGNGNLEVVRYITEHYKDLMHTVDNDGRNALHLASHKQSTHMLNVLIEAGLKPDSRTTDGWNILHIAAGNGNMEVVRYITENYKDLIHTVVNNGWNALHIASQKQSLPIIELLIEAGLRPDLRTTNGCNILHIAAGNGNMEVVRYITENYKDLIHTVDDDGLNALHYASLKQSLPMIELLLEAGLRPETRTTDGNNILHIAASNGNMEVVKYVTENYKDLIHTVDNNGWNALHYASLKQSLPMIELLLEAGLRPETRTTNGNNILHIAAINGNMEVVKYVTENYKDLIHTVDVNGCNAIHCASEAQSMPMLELLINAGLKPQTRAIGGSSIIHIAATFGNTEVVRFITENYKDIIHTVDNNGCNALHYASQNQSLPIIELWIEAGLRPETRTTDGHNILHISAYHGNMEIVRYITENYKDLIHTVDNIGENALHYASQNQSLPMIELLIEAGLRPETRTTDGLNILHIAASNGNMEVVRYITENYKDLIHTVHNNGWNALHFVSQKQSLPMIELLIEAGLRPETRTTDGLNILHIAACNGNMEIVRYITENYKDLIQTVDNIGENALHYASQNQSLPMIELLIEAGLRPETRTTDGLNILHIAASNGNMEVVRYITENYKDLIHTVHNNGWNALHFVSQKQSLPMIELLIEAGLRPETRTTDGLNILHIAACNGNMEIVRYITENYKDLIQTVDNIGENALHYASQNQSLPMIELLIEAGLRPETRTTDGLNILHIAACDGNMEIVRYITENYKDLLQTVDNIGLNALHYASHAQSVSMLELLIDAGLRPETRTTDGLNILHIAACDGNMEIVRYITENYKDLLQTVDNIGLNALHYASHAQSVSMLELLINAGLKPQTRAIGGSSIIHIAAIFGNMEVVRFITENYKDLIHTVDKNGGNALHYASPKQNLPMIELLIEAGLKPETRTTDGNNILHIAVSNGNMEVVKYVTENYKDLIHTVNNNEGNAIHCASEAQSMPMLELLMNAGLKPQTRAIGGSSIIHIAATFGNTEVVRFITENYKDIIHTVDNNGCNALHYASQEQSIPMIELLIEAGLKPETKKPNGSNILHIAANNGNMEVVRYITENYKDLIHTVHNDGWNALHFASQEQSLQLINVLIEAGLRPETRTTDGLNILHIAASNGNMEVVRYITENYKDLIHTVDNDGCNALHYASKKQSVHMINVLIEAGLKPKTKTIRGDNILSIAERNGNLEVVRFLNETYKGLNTNSCTIC